MAYEIKVHRITDESGAKVEIYPININGIVKPLIQGDGHKIKTIEDLTLADQETYIEHRPTGDIEWVLPHSKKFPNFIATYFSGEEYVTRQELYQNALTGEDIENPPLFPYQKFIYEYMRFGTPYRGVLLEHGLGSGKTRTAISVGESFRKEGLNILVLTPAFLATNFEQELLRWVPEFRTNKHLMHRYYHFISYNATGGGAANTGQWGKGSMFEQLARIGIGFPPSDQDSMDYINTKYRNLLPPKNMLIIIDEAHGLNRSFISTTSKVKAKLYRLLMMATDCKFIMLSATPMIGNPFELSPLYNVLRGPINNPQSGKTDGRTFTEHEGVFIQHFIAQDAGQGATSLVVNEEVFMRHILGLTSFLKGFTNDPTGLIYPKKDEQILSVPMSSYQGLYHDDILERELAVEKGKKKRTIKIGKPIAGPDHMMVLQMGQKFSEIHKIPSSYRTGSRQACNFAFPLQVPRPRGTPTYDAEELYTVNLQTHEPVSDPFNFTAGDNLEGLMEIYGHLADRGMIVHDFDAPEDETPASIKAYKLGLTYNIVVRFDVAKRKKHEKKKAYYLKADDPLVIQYLTEDDYYRYVMTMGDNKDRMALCLKKLGKAHATYGYFKLNPDPNAEGLLKYSVKMYLIYSSITSNIEKGASYVSFGNVASVQEAHEAIAKKSLMETIEGADEGEEGKDFFQAIFASDELDVALEEEEEEISEDKIEEEIGEGEEDVPIVDVTADSTDLPNVKVPIVIDEFDPFTNPADLDGVKFRDVYMTDEQLDTKYGEGNWIIKGGQALVYSFYNTVEGAGIFSMVLNAHGFTRFESNDVNIDPTLMSRTPRYAFIRGGMTTAQKITLLKVFNHGANMHGQLIKIVFVTQAAAEGISLYNVRQVHIMEPFWDNVMIRQVIGRAFRLRSHYHLPQDERIVHVFQYLAERSDDDALQRQLQGHHPIVCGQAECLPTTDNYVKALADRKDTFQQAFIELRQRVAVDCHINRFLNELVDLKCFMFPINSTGKAFELTLEQDTIDVGKKRHIGTVMVVGNIVKSAVTGEVTGIHTSEQVATTLTMKSGKTLKSNGIIIYEVPSKFKAGAEIDVNTLIIKGIQLRHKNAQGNDIVSVVDLHSDKYTLVVTAIIDPSMEQRLIAKLGASYQGNRK